MAVVKGKTKTVMTSVKTHARRLKKQKPKKTRKFDGKNYKYSGQLPKSTAKGFVRYKKRTDKKTSYRIVPTPITQDTGKLTDSKHYSIYKRRK